MVRPIVSVIALLALIVGVNGCQTARQVVRQQDGGIIAIPSNTNAWPYHHRQNAEQLMAQQCPNGYIIEREEEVVTGTVTNDSRSTDKKFLKSKNPYIDGGVIETERNTSTTSQTKEWQITYRAK